MFLFLEKKVTKKTEILTLAGGSFGMPCE